MALKKNYLNKTKELEEQKRKNDHIGVEIINLMNENKALTNDTTNISKKHGTVHSEYEKSMKQMNELQEEIAKLKEELVNANAQTERVKNEKRKAELMVERLRVEYEGKKTQLDKESVILAKQAEEIEKRESLKKVEVVESKKGDKEQWEKDKISFQRRYKELSRKMEAANTEILEHKANFDQLKTEKSKLAIEFEDLQNEYRASLGKVTGKVAESELIESFKNRENKLKAENEELSKKFDVFLWKCKELREYSRELKYLAEDLSPDNEDKPDILTRKNRASFQKKN